MAVSDVAKRNGNLAKAMKRKTSWRVAALSNNGGAWY